LYPIGFESVLFEDFLLVLLRALQGERSETHHHAAISNLTN
jgi:hypothetical protein